MNDVDARMDRLRRAARYRYQQLVDSEIERGRSTRTKCARNADC